MDVPVINASIHRAVNDNRHAEKRVIAMAAAQFTLRLLVILAGCLIRSRYVMASGTIPLGLLTFFIADIRKLRYDNPDRRCRGRGIAAARVAAAGQCG
jgi:hypothetical protein